MLAMSSARTDWAQCASRRVRVDIAQTALHLHAGVFSFRLIPLCSGWRWSRTVMSPVSSARGLLSRRKCRAELWSYFKLSFLCLLLCCTHKLTLYVFSRSSFVPHTRMSIPHLMSWKYTTQIFRFFQETTK